MHSSHASMASFSVDGLCCLLDYKGRMACGKFSEGRILPRLVAAVWSTYYEMSCWAFAHQELGKLKKGFLPVMTMIKVQCDLSVMCL